MAIALLTLELYIPLAESLKDKRGVLRAELIRAQFAAEGWTAHRALEGAKSVV